MRLADTPAAARAGGDVEAVPAGSGGSAGGVGLAAANNAGLAAADDAAPRTMGGTAPGLADGTAPDAARATVLSAAGGPAPGSADGATFAAAIAALKAARDAVTEVREDLEIEDWPAPKRLAPYAVALEATAYRDGQEAGSAKLMLLHDPAGRDGWTGTFRVVVQVYADVEEEMAADPMLGEVGWSWLTDALDLHAPGYGAPSGTVTRVITEGYGGKAEEPPSTAFELRASWCPDGDQLDDELGGAVFAWCDLLAAAAGLPAQPPGTRMLGQRGHGPAAGRHGAGKHGAGKHGAGRGRRQ